LNQEGWQPFSILTTDVLDNTSGGLRKGAANLTLLTAGTEADMQTLAGWDGATFRVSFNAVKGTHPNRNTGAFDDPTDYDAADEIRVADLRLQQNLLDGQLTIKLGQADASDDFGQGANSSMFLNSAIVSQPVLYNQVLANRDAAMAVYPLNTPGLVVRLDPKGLPFYTISGIYLCDPGPDVSGNHGLDWRFGGGVEVMQEVGWHYRAAPAAGTMAIGGFYNDGRFTNWNTGDTQRGIWGGYALVNQVLWQRAGADPANPESSLAGFVAGAGAGPDSRTGPAFDYCAGLNWQGPLPGRKTDAASVAVLHTGFSPDYTRSAFNPNGPGLTPPGETVLEFTYQLAVTPWCNVQPDAQVIFHPADAGPGARGTATVAGVRVVVTF
jgi:porin